MKPHTVIETCRASHGRLLADLAQLTDAQFREASLLPGYSRAHVVAHLTNKAVAHVSVFEGAAIGEVRRLHPAGHDPDAAAGTGASRSADNLLDHLARALTRLEAAWSDLHGTLWDSEAIMMAGPRSMVEVVAHHLRNVEVHHVDLDIGYRPSDWPDVFVQSELSRRLRTLPDRVDHADLLMWLLDRAPAPDLAPW